MIGSFAGEFPALYPVGIIEGKPYGMLKFVLGFYKSARCAERRIMSFVSFWSFPSWEYG